MAQNAVENATPPSTANIGKRLRPASSSGHSDLTFREEAPSPDVIAPSLLKKHYDEVGAQKQLTKQPDPDWKFYAEQYEKGRLIFVVGRDPFGIMRGYSVTLLYPHPHYKTVWVASDDLHYLHPLYRGKGTGGEMLRYAEQCAYDAGARLFMGRHKAGQFDAEHRAIYEEMGYKLTDLVYTKDLSDAPPPLG